MNDKIYTLEVKSGFYGREWRFCSLYNGMRGIWGTKEDAEREGECHHRVIQELYGVKFTNQFLPASVEELARDIDRAWCDWSGYESGMSQEEFAAAHLLSRYKIERRE